MASSSERRPTHACIIWLDRTIGKNSDSNILREKLSELSDLSMFTEPNACYAKINSVNSSSLIVVIVSGSFGETFTPRIHKFEQVKCIIVYCGDRDKHEKWARQYAKVCAVETELERILQKTQKQIFALQTKDKKPISSYFYSSFVWIHIFILILRRMPFGSYKEFIDFCRVTYAENPEQLRIIDEFDREYRPKKAIWWYTRECFLYKMINNAFRTIDIDVLLKCRFFLFDLQAHILAINKDFRRNIPEQAKFATVYRGQLMNEEQLEEMKRSVGKYFMINSFMSAAHERNVALAFARYNIDSHCKGVLFQITFSLRQAVFAHVEELGYYQMETETLFIMGSIFRIESVEPFEDNLYLIRLIQTGEEGTIFKDLVNYYMDHEVHEETSYVHIGNLMQDIGKLDEAKTMYDLALKNVTATHHHFALIHVGLASLALKCNDIPDALEHCTIAFEATRQHLQDPQPVLVRIHMTFGKILIQEGDLSTAMEHLVEAQRIGTEGLLNDPILLAKIEDLIGNIYFEQSNYPIALEHYEHAQDMRDSSQVPYNHPDRGLSLENIGRVYFKQNKVRKSLNNLEAAVDLYSKSQTIDQGHIRHLCEIINKIKLESSS